MSVNLYFQYDNRNKRAATWSEAAQNPSTLSEAAITVSDAEYALMLKNYLIHVDGSKSRITLTKPLNLTIQDDKAALQAMVDANDVSMTAIAKLLLKIIP